MNGYDGHALSVEELSVFIEDIVFVVEKKYSSPFRRVNYENQIC
jgi:hypothetical protein